MENQNQELSHDDIWDDSMLVDSWNEALAEYKVISKIWDVRIEQQAGEDS